MNNEFNRITDLTDAIGVVFHDQDEIAELCAETGELTPEAEDIQERVEATKYIVEHDGTDMLGRGIKEAEDKLKMWKAEKDHAARMVKATQSTIDFYKYLVSEVMRVTGKDKVKGNHYSFTAYTSERTTVNMDEIDERWKQIAEKGAREMGLPGYIDIELKTTVSKIQEWAPSHDGQGIAFLETETAPAVRFTKPRASKEDK